MKLQREEKKLTVKKACEEYQKKNRLRNLAEANFSA